MTRPMPRDGIGGPPPDPGRCRFLLPVKATIAHLPVVGAVLLLCACSAPPSTVPLGEALDVLPLSGRFDLSRLPDDWFVAGDISPSQISGGRSGGYPMIGVSSGDRAFLVARRTDARLAVTPFLHWAWSVRSGGGAMHPVRVVAGLQAGAGDKRQGGLLDGMLAALTPTRSLPPHDRVISVRWGSSALQRGNLSSASIGSDGRQEVQYTARGGRENGGVWWDESVDLFRIFKERWPDDDPLATRIVFIGVAAAPAPRTMSIAGLRLSR